MKTKYSDALIIGSGFGGAAPALRLAKAGLVVTVLEKGPAIDPYKDFQHTQDPKYLLRYLKNLKGKGLSFNYIEGLGGASGFYEMLSFRAPALIYRQTDRKGRPLWPEGLGQDTLAPYFNQAEKMLKVYQIREKEVPKTGQVFSLLMKNLGYSTDRARYATNGCLDCGRCLTGCIYGAKQSLLVNYLPEAEAAGATIVTGMDAREIIPLSHPEADRQGATALPGEPYRYDVLCRNTGSEGEEYRFRTKLLVLAASTIGTTGLLLASRKNLRAMSDQVGKNIVFNGKAEQAGLLPDWCPDGDMFTGRSHPGVISYEFLESHHAMVTAGKLLPLQVFGTVRLSYDDQDAPNNFWGADHVELMKKLRTRIIFLAALGMTPPAGELSRRPDGSLRLKLTGGEELRNYLEGNRKILKSIILDNGGKLLKVQAIGQNGRPKKTRTVTSSHQMGSCRMADDKSRGVVNTQGEVFGHPGLYISDGATIPSSLIVNPSLTILANAERIADGILEKFGLARLELEAA